MSKEFFKGIFQAKYDSGRWKEVLTKLFPQRDFYLATDVDLNDSQQKEAKSIRLLGEMELQDRSCIQFYEVKLKDGKKVTRNRVGLRNIIKSEVIPGHVDGALVTYYSENTRDWRITFISKSLYWDNENKQVKTETHPKRYTYVVGENESCTTAIERFDWLLEQTHQVRIIDDLLNAFSVEKISNEFFAGYKHQFEKLVAYIEENDFNKNLFRVKGRKFDSKAEEKEFLEKSIRNWVKKFQGRIVFLYFLQKKGWLGVTDGNWGNGQKDFMRRLFDGFKDKKNFYEECLTELFFNTLNRDRSKSNHLFNITKTQVPFLNGGLFDKEENEPTRLKFKPEDIDELLQFFDQYNFTIDENSPDDQDIGVDPEMLGLIFENLLEENRKKTGAFYTPKEVVHFMCRESLSQYLQREMKNSLNDRQLKTLDDFIKGNVQDTPALIKEKSIAGKIEKALRDVRICDPAIGSGAFPMGLVFEILRLKRELSPFLEKKNFDYQKEKLSIIQNSIYGVDVDKGAVDIARLRFWLALIVDEEVPSPLPNLDYKIMQGNSLMESFEGLQLDVVKTDDAGFSVKNPQIDMFTEQVIDGQTKFSVEQKETLHQLVDDFFDPENHARKAEIQTEIDDLIHSHINNCYLAVQTKLEEQILNTESKIRQVKTSTVTSNKQKEDKKKAIEKLERSLKLLKKKEAENEKIKERLDIVQETDERPYFLWHLMFKEVFDKGGFDIVIGNPPYGVKFDDYKEEPFQLGSNDSYGVFTSMALKKLLKPQGTLCFIVSDTWLTIKSHKPLREQVLSWQLDKVIRLHIDCFRATVNSCIFSVTKTAAVSDPEHQVLAADLTNISTRKNIPLFRDRLFKLEENAGISTTEFAVYQYPQQLISINSNKPVFVASPKLFALMNDTSCEKTKRIIESGEEEKEIEIRKIPINGGVIELVRFGDIAEVKVGLQTGDNEYYLYQNPNARGNYKDINAYTDLLLTENDLNSIRSNEEIRLKVIECGIHKSKKEKAFDEERWFEGRYILPYDKGGESDTDDGWLPNYYVPTNYFIDWSSEALSRLKTYTIAQRIKDNNENKEIKAHYKTTTAAVIRNAESYFTEGITFSRTGIYSPSFRLNSSSVFDTEGSAIYFGNDYNIYSALGIVNSRIVRYLLKNFIGHTVHSQVDELKEIPFLTSNNDDIEQFVLSTIEKQKKDLRYDYLSNEQSEIDKSAYDCYGIGQELINEIETWFARRYPKLAKYANILPAEDLVDAQEISGTQNKCDGHLETIKAGENRRVEFKSTLRWDIRKGTIEKYIEHSVGKTIAAFLNSDGGELFIGVDDDGNILGLDADFNSFKGGNKKDEFLKHFDNLVQNYFGNHFTRMLQIDFCELEGKTVAVVTVAGKAHEQVFLKDSGKELFYVRRFSSTVELTLREAVAYIKEHWG